MKEAISEQEWIWCGGAHHFVGRRECSFHLATQVGDVLISTVGQYAPDGDNWQTLSLSDDSYYETYISRVEGGGEGCGIEGWTSESGEVVEHYADALSANRGHLAHCRNASVLPMVEEPS